MPFYFHCIRPNDKKQPSVVSSDLVEQQWRSQRLFRQVEICRDSSFLLKEPYDLNGVTCDDESLLMWLKGLLGSDDGTPNVRVSASSMIQFKSISLVEKLELLLESREAEAATRIQSLFLMIVWRHRYISKKRERRGLSNELLAWYGLEKKDTVKKLLEKYNGREDELQSKLELKKKSKFQEEKTMHQLASDIHALCLSTQGGLDSQAVNDILNDDTMRELLQHNEKIVLALRDMSLNPDILTSQLADYELRSFYQKLWAAYHDALVEVGDDPEMILFHSEDDGFRATLERFLDTLVLEKQREEEQRALAAITNLVQPLTVDEEVLEVHGSAGVGDEDAEMLELLMSVQFGPSLMAAMNQDSYFVQALQDPILMTSMHQLMANPKDFATSATLQHPAVREFFLKLIALSFAVQEQSDEE
ncbi:hypothetical protein PHMEG_0006173 [Phytophthora megakarya]|uniref:Uncharacterized protein n=1 Tax=Phytophthora megakarya TaxID=4795 RepID=A0A225WPD4_9STRA|nr:hypothetical protein PHMEG_0006173 [Phytophthora megakarya]